MKFAKSVVASLPEPIKKLIRSMLSATGLHQTQDKTRAYVAAGAAPIHSLHDLGPLSSMWLRNAICAFDAASAKQKAATSVAIFNEVAKYPCGADGLSSAYAESRYGMHPLFRQITAARLLGIGQYRASFEILREIARESRTPFDAAMAAWPLMRPSGREQSALDYLSEQCATFPDDITLRVHKATALYCVGRTAEGNTEIARVKSPLDAMLTDGYGRHLQDLRVELARAKSEKRIYRHFNFDETSYREDLIDNHWEPYHHWMTTQSNYVMFGWLNDFFAKKLFDLSADIDEVYNFGVMCARPDAQAAAKRPAAKFIGVDRQKKTAALNSQAFPLPNMVFLSAEIEDVLASMPAGPSRALFHARTATLCYPEKIKQLYQSCARRGFKRIGLFENIALSHDTYQFYDMGGDIHGESIIYKSDQFIHDYKTMLTQAGYTVVKEKRMFSPLITPFSEIDLGSAHIYLEAEI